MTPQQETQSPIDISQEAVEKQLQAMLESSVFQRASRPARFLSFVVKRALQHPGKSATEGEIANAVFDRDNLDPRIDPIVRVEAARLRKRITEYYEGPGSNDPLRIQLSQRGYLPEIQKSTVSEQMNGRHAGSPSAPPVMTLAILPFATLDDDPNSAIKSYAQGVAEELIAAVTDITSIAVVARTSAQQFEGPVDVREVGKRLGVTHVLEGSLRQGDQHLRATVNLVDCSTGFTTWSKTLEQPPLADSIVTQAALGSALAEAIASFATTD